MLPGYHPSQVRRDMARVTPGLYATQCDAPFLAAAAAMIAQGGACASDFKLVRGCTTLPLTTHH